MATSLNSVPLGQSGTGAAYVLDQRQALAPFQTFASMSANKAALERERAKQQAAEDEKIRARANKLFDNPEETGLQFQAGLRDRYKGFEQNYVSRVQKSGGKLTAQDLDELEREKFNISLYAKQGKTVQEGLDVINRDLLKNKYYKTADVKSQVSSEIMDMSTGTVKDPTSIDMAKVLENTATNYKNLNIGTLSNDFVKSLGTQVTERFYRQGQFRVEEAQKSNLPVMADKTGKWIPDKNGNPILKITPFLIMEARKSPEMAIYLDGRLKEEDEKFKADPTYKPMTQDGILEEVLKSEVYVQENKNYDLWPDDKKPSDARGRREEEDTDLRYRQLQKILQGDQSAATSLIGSNLNGGRVIDVKVIPQSPDNANPNQPIRNFLQGKQGSTETNQVVVRVAKGFTQDKNEFGQPVGDRRPIIEEVVLDASNPESLILGNTLLNSKTGEKKVRVENIQTRITSDPKFKQPKDPLGFGSSPKAKTKNNPLGF